MLWQPARIVDKIWRHETGKCISIANSEIFQIFDEDMLFELADDCILLFAASFVSVTFR